MTRLRLPIALSIAALLGAGVCAAGEIYKWTDDEGNVHYEDRPTGDRNMEVVDIVSRDTDNSVVQARLDSDREAREAARKEAEGQPPEKTREELRAEQLAREDRCEQAREQLSAMLAARRLYKEDADGEREYLDDAQIDEARAQAEIKVAEHCG